MDYETPAVVASYDSGDLLGEALAISSVLPIDE